MGEQEEAEGEEKEKDTGWGAVRDSLTAPSNRESEGAKGRKNKWSWEADRVAG